jgi:hypothetical protein
MSEQWDYIWVVEVGEYSDRNVFCACPTEEMAKAVAPQVRGYASQVPFVKAPVKPVPDLHMSVSMTLRDGMAVDEGLEYESLIWPWDDDPGVQWTWMHRLDGRGVLSVHGTDLQRVRKVFSERRAMFMADDAARMAKCVYGRGASSRTASRPEPPLPERA